MHDRSLDGDGEEGTRRPLRDGLQSEDGTQDGDGKDDEGDGAGDAASSHAQNGQPGRTQEGAEAEHPMSVPMSMYAQMHVTKAR
eukprot:s122_g35.t1